jgi:hypothetical protein
VAAFRLDLDAYRAYAAAVSRRLESYLRDLGDDEAAERLDLLELLPALEVYPEVDWTLNKVELLTFAGVAHAAEHMGRRSSSRACSSGVACASSSVRRCVTARIQDVPVLRLPGLRRARRLGPHAPRHRRTDYGASLKRARRRPASRRVSSSPATVPAQTVPWIRAAHASRREAHADRCVASTASCPYFCNLKHSIPADLCRILRADRCVR